MEPATTRLLDVSGHAPYRPRVPRETRRLLVTSVIALLALWALARLRFPDRPVTPNPVPPLLSQIASSVKFSDLATVVTDLRTRLGPSLVTLVPADLSRRVARPSDRIAGLRTHDDLAIAVLPPDMRADERDPLGVIAEDAISGLAVVRVQADAPVASPNVWMPESLDQPRYAIASSPSRMTVSLRPAFIGSLTPVDAPEWNGTIWALPRDSTLVPGTFLFTEDAALVGVTAPYGAGVAVVPGAALLAAADALAKAPPPRPGEIGIDVQPLTPSLSIASGAEGGVVVAWVDPDGAAARSLMPGDVIQAVDGVAVPTPEHWSVHVARLRAGEEMHLNVIRRGSVMDIAVMPSPPRDSLDAAPLGIAGRSAPRVGVEVVRVDPGSAAAAGGIEPGDVITMIDGLASPSPAQLRSAYESAKRGEMLILAILRGTSHQVIALQR